MYSIEKQNQEINQVLSTNNSIGKLLSGFLVFMTISISFGFLLGHFVFPKNCTNCKTVVEEMRTKDNAYIDFVSGTEYIANIGGLDQGQVIIRVTDYRGNPLNASCQASILNPDKTFYMSLQPMTNSSINGNYYKTFTIPTTTGIFEDYVNCSVQLGSRNLKVSKSSSFHVSPTLVLFQNISNQITTLNQTVVDGDLMLNNTVNYVHQDILDNLNITEGNLNDTLTTIINNMATYYSNLDMKLDNITSTILNSKDEIISEIEKSRSDIEIIQEWLSYMFGKVSDKSLDEGQTWIDKIVGKKVTLPDLKIPRPN